ERFATGEDGQALRRERRDFIDDSEALLSAELAAIGEVLRAHQGRSAGIQVAVLAGEIAAIGEVPRDDVGPGECAQFATPKLQFTYQRSLGRRRGSLRSPPGLPCRAQTSRCRSAPSGV